MAPAAEASSNWLSFSLSPMEMLATSHPQPHDSTPQILTNPLSSSHHYFLDPFYSNDWGNVRGQGMYGNYEMENPTTVPKLEDFLGGDNNTASYNNNTTTQTESTQDSSSQLTHLYDSGHHHNYFNGGFQAAFSANSGSEVDDSASVTRTTQQQLGCGGEFVTQSIESAQTELPPPATTTTAGNLSLAVVVSEKAAGIDSDNTVKKISDTFGQRTSIYRGVTRHRWTGRYEAHLWDNSCRREGQARKGRQVYLGGYDKEEKAARSYDLAALKYWGPTATTNFPISTYTKELEDMKHATKQEFIASLRRKSSGFSRGASIYRGVTRHHQQGRWQARIGRVAGNKDLYLGTFATEEEAAEAYDIAAIKFRGVNAVTNFEMNRYDVDAILKSNLPIGGAAKRLKLATEASGDQNKPTLLSHHHQSGGSSTINFASIQAAAATPVSCAMPFDAIFHENLLHHLGSSNGGGQVISSYSTEPYGSAPTPVSYGSASLTPMALMPQTQGEFYIWPHHQSYN